MDRYTFARDLVNSTALAAGTIDLDNDELAVIDVSETNGKLKLKKMSPRAFLNAALRQTLALRISDVRNSDGTALAAAAAAGVFGISATPGTSLFLASEAANNNAKTDTAILEIVLPPHYKAGSDVTVTANAKLVGAGTLTTKTLALAAYLTANDGTQGASLIATAAKALTTAAADYAYVITGTTLNPGDRLLLKATVALVETGAVATHAELNSLRLSF